MRIGTLQREMQSKEQEKNDQIALVEKKTHNWSWRINN